MAIRLQPAGVGGACAELEERGPVRHRTALRSVRACLAGAIGAPAGHDSGVLDPAREGVARADLGKRPGGRARLPAAVITPAGDRPVGPDPARVVEARADLGKRSKRRRPGPTPAGDRPVRFDAARVLVADADLGEGGAVRHRAMLRNVDVGYVESIGQLVGAGAAEDGSVVANGATDVSTGADLGEGHTAFKSGVPEAEEDRVRRDPAVPATTLRHLSGITRVDDSALHAQPRWDTGQGLAVGESPPADDLPVVPHPARRRPASADRRQALHGAGAAGRTRLPVRVVAPAGEVAR